MRIKSKHVIIKNPVSLVATVKKIPDENNLRQERLLLECGLQGFSPWSTDSSAVTLRRG
jgi:hypothetical protein